MGARTGSTGPARTSGAEGPRPTRASSLRRAIADLSAITVATGISMALAFAVQVLLTRALAPAGYGALSTAISAIALTAPLAGLGVGKFWLRVFGAHGWRGLAWLGPTVRLAAVGTAVSALTVIAWTSFAALDRTIVAVTLIMLPTLLLYPASETLDAKLQVEANYVALAVRQLLPNLARTVVAVVAVAFGIQAVGVSIGLSAALTALAALFIAEVARASNGNLRLVGHGPRPEELTAAAPSLAEVARSAWPFALSGVFYNVYYQSDVMMLGWLRGPEAAGIYNVAFAVMAAVYLVPSIVHQRYLLPKLHRWIEHDKPKLLAVYRFGNGATLALGVAVAALLLALSPFAVRLVFGEDYAEAGRVLQVLALAVPGRYLATSVGAVLATADNMRRKVWLMGLSALVNLTLNLLLIPRIGATGAAIATVASETVLLVSYLLAVRAYVFGQEALRGWTLVPGGWNADR